MEEDWKKTKEGKEELAQLEKYKKLLTVGINI